MLQIEDIKDKNVLLRADLDVPIIGGKIENTFRLEALLPTLKFCQSHARKTLLIGHLGRPNGKDQSLSLAPIQEWLKTRLNQDIPLIVSGFSPGECWRGESPLYIMENLRFDPREQSIDREFASSLSMEADIYVYEAFASYNPSSSMQIIPELVPTITGIQFDREINTLSDLISKPAHPTLLIASGAKMDKLEILRQISGKFDQVLFGGKFAKPSFLTPDGLDLNDEAINVFVEAISQAKTIVLNGPLGAFEDGTHTKATSAVFSALKSSSAFTVLGGGDTLSAIPFLGFSYADYGFVSTGGGAMLEFINTGTHPLLEILKHAKV